MVSDETKSVIARAKEIYKERLESDLEAHHRDEIVAIEPDSGDFFIGATFDEAVKLARGQIPVEIIAYDLDRPRRGVSYWSDELVDRNGRRALHRQVHYWLQSFSAGELKLSSRQIQHRLLTSDS